MIASLNLHTQGTVIFVDFIEISMEYSHCLNCNSHLSFTGEICIYTCSPLTPTTYPLVSKQAPNTLTHTPYSLLRLTLSLSPHTYIHTDIHTNTHTLTHTASTVPGMFLNQ